MNDKGIAHPLLIFLIAAVIVGLFGYQKYVDRKPPAPKRETESSYIRKKTDQDPVVEEESGDASCEDKYCEKYAWQYYMLNKDRVFYFLDNGNIYEVDAETTDVKVLVNAEKDILTFDISSDKKKVTYSIREDNYSAEEDMFVDQFGNVVVLLDFDTNEKKEIYRIRDLASEMQVRDLQFTPDGEKLLITSNGVRVADLASGKVEAFHTVKYNDFCSVFRVNDISPDSSRALIKKGCYEGSSQFIIDIANGRKISTFENGYVGGGEYAVVFVNNESLFGYSNKINFLGGEEGEYSDSYDYVIYDLFGKRVNELEDFKINAPPYRTEKFGNKVFLHFFADTGGRNIEESFYSVETGNYKIEKLDRNLPVVLMTANNKTLWYHDPESDQYIRLYKLQSDINAPLILVE